jgi:hypothetical protein
MGQPYPPRGWVSDLGSALCRLGVLHDQLGPILQEVEWRDLFARPRNHFHVLGVHCRSQSGHFHPDLTEGDHEVRPSLEVRFGAESRPELLLQQLRAVESRRDDGDRLQLRIASFRRVRAIVDESHAAS